MIRGELSGAESRGGLHMLHIHLGDFAKTPGSERVIPSGSVVGQLAKAMSRCSYRPAS